MSDADDLRRYRAQYDDTDMSMEKMAYEALRCD